MSARVLVVYGSHHGATRGIAERIAATLVTSGLGATVRSADEAGDLEGYDAFVVGSAVYAFRWVKAASGFVRRNRMLLASRPTWLFSSGPLGTDTVDKQGKDVLEGAIPREIPEFQNTIQPRDHRVFFGAYDPDSKPVGLAERFMHLIPAAREALPAGDFRDWTAIEDWARGIAAALARVPAGVG